MTLNNQKGERAIIAACAYLGTLVVACVVMWVLVFIGGNPMKFTSTMIVDESGSATNRLEIGTVIGVRRGVCSTEKVGVKFFPSLKDSHGQQFTLPPGVYDIPQGCAEKAYGFVVPDIPPGEYTYTCAFQFQTSLVGREETLMTPAVKVMVVKK